MPVEEAKADAKVECPDCGKMTLQKTLRLSQGPNCVAKKQQQATPETEVQNLTNDTSEYGAQRRLYGKREERSARREALVAELVQNAF